jgi:3-methyladenine DNA glycosylase/8-oxoguanine DNA glycosylase
VIQGLGANRRGATGPGRAVYEHNGRVPALRYRSRLPLDLRRTLAGLRRGAGDPTHRDVNGVIWRTVPAVPGGPGPATLRLEQTADGEVLAAAWGPGAEAALRGVPDLLGARDQSSALALPAGPLRDLSRRFAGVRLLRTGRVFEAIVPAVLEQKVTGVEAFRAWRQLVRRYGTPAPGPAPEGMAVMPGPEVWRRIPSWDWHRAGVDAKRSQTILAACAVASALERTLALGTGAAVASALRTVPGVGVWTAAEVAQRAHGDPDAVSVGDFHLANRVGWALAGRARSDDAQMLELLEPFRPYRQRVVRLIELGASRPPAFGPRHAIRSYANI